MLRDHLPLWTWISPIAGWLLFVATSGFAHPALNVAIGAEYVAVCLPAFSPATVHRDES
jgi:hypothetical protein